MQAIRLLTFALLLGAFTNCAMYAQPPDYGSPRGSQPGYDDYDNDRDYDYDDDLYYEHSPAPQGDVGFFYDELSPYGDWLLTSRYGWAWFPRNLHPYWRPYVDGRWVTTEYGWTWVSNEPFGWATYHYGRWAWDSRFGWLWVPGTDWGPAWVSWQYGGEYVGWAPLPPSVGFEVGFGIRLGGFDLSVGIRPDAYNFVPLRSIFETRISGYRLPTARNVTIIHNTTNITHYTYVDNRVVNRGPEYGLVAKATGRPVRQLRVTEGKTKTHSEATSSEVRIYRAEKQKLETVRNVRRDHGKQPAQLPRAESAKNQPTAERRDPHDIVVAPRAVRAPKPDSREIEKRELRQKQELERYQGDQKRKLEKLHTQEVTKSRAQADRNQVEKRHQAERAALQQEQRDSEKQLAARQEAQRRAATANPRDDKNRDGQAQQNKEKKEEKEGKGKAKPKKKDKGGGGGSGGQAW